MRPLWLALALLCALAGPLRAEPLRGVWVAGPAHSGFWRERTAMRAELQRFQAAGINRVYAVMLLAGRTLYPSARMQQLTGVPLLEELSGRDPLQELLDEAEPLGLGVVAWLEFGFASHHESAPATGLLRRRPDWAALDRDGRPVVKHGFHWMDGLHPEVQQLLIDLSVELLQRYPRLLGVQGDDRLPAMPASGGYHPERLRAFGWRPSQPLPAEQDPAWLRWRAEQLTAFLRRWRAAVKAVRADALLSLAPSPHPWGLQEYLQDGPAWLRDGLADELLPQLYRRDRAGVARLLADLQQQVPAELRARVAPGLLLALGGRTVATPALVRGWLEDGRAAGFDGAVYFHSGGLAALPR